MSVVKTFEGRTALTELCEWTNVAKSVYFYTPKAGKRGAKPSTHTRLKSGELVSNEVVTGEITRLLTREYCCYGYQNITADLRGLSYQINAKKVYRLMDQS